MIVFIIEGVLLILSAIYYVLSRSAEWLIFVGLILVAMAIERLITAMQELIPGDIIEVDADALEWKPADKILPPEPVDGTYLEYNVVLAGSKKTTTLEYWGGGLWMEPDGCGESYIVTYWREMPMPPKEVKNE